MLPHALPLIPYVAVISAILLGIAIAAICLSQRSYRAGFGASWWQSILSVFRKLRAVMSKTRPLRPDVIVHDPASSKPHDLDDPFFDPKVQERIGAAIGNATRKT
jgi:hypothetical protein